MKIYFIYIWSHRADANTQSTAADGPCMCLETAEKFVALQVCSFGTFGATMYCCCSINLGNAVHEDTGSPILCSAYLFQSKIQGLRSMFRGVSLVVRFFYKTLQKLAKQFMVQCLCATAGIAFHFLLLLTALTSCDLVGLMVSWKAHTIEYCTDVAFIWFIKTFISHPSVPQ